MNPKLVDVRAITVVGFEMSGTEEEIAAMRPEWKKRFLETASQIPSQTDGYLMDICLKRAGQLYTHCIAMEVSHIDIIPSGMSSLTIPAGSYALLELDGQEKDVKNGFRSILAWAREHHIRLDPNEFRIHVTIHGEQHHLYWRLANKRSEAAEEAV
ncbi:GyrI-like domain-containing protein [Domibacillus sp. DTU_2020_1001157_1_SI_ALB_TIR_016]|uniref:GyrI-like domain-containing protein n=1 Tax=Domibacillus sp. DTU_2020_1001157_1_SI_ALB_TIR_016 TaxID=3077789 RepID=UPI0028E54179|nr:GyrI-like domain-containing protein [Domibacillus sp. DTU_2020_1001157_1_SI_ALB_TIR_016]WNS81042.1 GyrI-like domain-containing protein [Domibacillus sp. DTU_2020_1001157_1_SI_ALB_TIR_016]